MATQLGDVRNHARVGAGHQPTGFLSFVVAHQHPAGAAGGGGYVRAPLVKDHIQAGAQPIPALLEGRDARVAAADLEGDGAGGKCYPVAEARLFVRPSRWDTRLDAEVATDNGS